MQPITDAGRPARPLHLSYTTKHSEKKTKQQATTTTKHTTNNKAIATPTPTKGPTKITQQKGT